MNKLITILILFCTQQLFAQPNCEAFKYYGDELKYQACKAAEKAAGHYQFSRAYQEALDEAIAIDPTFDYAYRAKSTAYLKSGDFVTWKALMDKAVQYDPVANLGYRGWCRLQFFRDYEGAIADIELLDSLADHDIGHSVNSDYHLHIGRALCYKSLGQPEKAIAIIERQLQDSTHIIGLYDYLHLGVLYMDVGIYDQAIQYLKRQETENDLAENRYYLALAYKAVGQNELYIENLMFASDLYENNMSMLDFYVEMIDQIFLEDIENELAKASRFDK